MTTVEKIIAFEKNYIPWWDREELVDETYISKMLGTRKGRRDLYECFRMFADDNVDWQEAFDDAVDIIVDIIEIERRYA